MNFFFFFAFKKARKLKILIEKMFFRSHLKYLIYSHNTHL